MSVPVELGGLAEVMGRYRFAYLLTSTVGAPHAVAVAPLFDEGEFVLHGVGRRSRENLLARPEVSLVWPPESEGGYSLIVDGQASARDDAVRIRPRRAVLHRPAPRPEPVAPGACGSDCVELELPTPPV